MITAAAIGQDLTKDEFNCGYCGNKCPIGMKCMEGVCEGGEKKPEKKPVKKPEASPPPPPPDSPPPPGPPDSPPPPPPPENPVSLQCIVVHLNKLSG